MKKVEKNEKIWFHNFINCRFFVLGIAIVKKGFPAYYHRHKEKENYLYLLGRGRMLQNKKIVNVRAPFFIKIKSNDYHCMTPVSKKVVLLYFFDKGPFEKIQYDFLEKKL